jgi:hypothetical protein
MVALAAGAEPMNWLTVAKAATATAVWLRELWPWLLVLGIPSGECGFRKVYPSGHGSDYHILIPIPVSNCNLARTLANIHNPALGARLSGESSMNQSILNATCALAALFLLTTAAPAACPDSPKVMGAQPKDKDRLLKACQADGAKMHSICDGVPTCTQADTKETLKQKVTNAQKCIDARRKITRDWYNGNDDAGHDAAVEGKINQANNCIVLLSNK